MASKTISFYGEEAAAIIATLTAKDARIADLEQQLAASQAMQCTSPFDYSPPCRGIQRVKDELTHLKTCSATEICVENPNILEYCRQMEQQLAAKDEQIKAMQDWMKRLNYIGPAWEALYVPKFLAAIDKELKP
jgi:hypothetical protein